ncbi:MAG: TolC family protein [Ignavibacteriae bacterium]|nr:TolC family protein [Ignavibacteriota bacterium]
MNRGFLLFVVALVPLCIHGQSLQQALSLRDALTIGIKNSPDLRAAEAGVDAARGRFWSGISLPSPEISVAHEYIPNGLGLESYTERTIGVTQSFEFPTNYFLRGSVLASNRDALQAVGEQALRRVIRRIRNSYYAAWGTQRKLRYARDNIALSDSIMAKVEVRARVGEAHPLEALTARVQQSEARNDLMAARNELAVAYAELNNAMGLSRMEFDTSVVLTDSLVASSRPTNIDSLRVLVEERNPQLWAARARMESATASRALAWSTLLPSFTVSYFNQMRDGVKDYYGASLSISVPLWFMMNTRGQVEESQAGIALAEAEFAATRNTLLVELRTAVSNLQNNRNSVRLYETDLIPQAEEVYRTANRGYATGDLSYLEYLQARVTLLATRRNYLTTLMNYVHSETLLDELTGESDDMQLKSEKP